jgi:DNA-binding winged helix-turn-helix (wHTH) protein/tetratricopeptide (TPR) repeat protein
VEDPNVAAIAFPPFQLDLLAGQLTRGKEVIALRPKTYAVLSYLLQRPGELVSNKELFHAFWADVAVTQDTLTKTIGELRQALGDDARRPRFIETVHRRGFRFIGPVQTEDTQVQRRPTRAGARSTSGIRRLPPLFLGRTQELQRLEEVFAEARLGERKLVFITGEAGIGKTALVEAFLHSSAVRKDPDVRVAQGYSIEQTGAREPYFPVLTALGRLAGSGVPESFVPLLRRYAPTWLVQMPWLLDPAEATALRLSLPGVRPERMLRELAVFLERISESTSLILVLEDLHWSDPSTAELLAMLGQSREPARLMILATYRPAEAAVQEHPLLQAKQRLQLHHQCREIALPYLSHDDVEAYLAARFPGASFPGGLSRLIHQHTDGNPLFVVAVVDQLRTRGWLVDTAPGWALTVPLETLRIEVSDDVREMIRAQFHALSPAEQSLLEAAAVAGVKFSADEVAAGIEGESDVVSVVCERLLYAGRFLRLAGTTELPNDRVARRYSFIHTLYQHVLYDVIPDERRGRLHSRIGEFLESTYGDLRERIAAQLAHHFQQGRSYDRAIEYLAGAARTAHRRFAAREAVASLEEALALLLHVKDPEERRRREIQLRLPLGSALNLVYGYASDEVSANYERTLALCEEAGDLPQLFEVLYALWYSQALRADAVSAPRTAQRLVELAERLDGAAPRVVAASAVGRAAAYLGDFRKARDVLEKCLATSESAGVEFDPRTYGVHPTVAIRHHYAYALHFLGHADTARAECRNAMSVAEKIGSPFTLAAANVHSALLHMYGRDVAEARRFSDHAIALSSEHGFPLWRNEAMAVRGWVEVDSGRFSTGIEQLREAVAFHTASGTKLATSMMLALLAEGCLRAGRLDDGIAAVEEGLTLATATLDRWCLPELWRLRGELLIQRDDSEAASCFQRALEKARQGHVKALELRAAISLARLWMSRDDVSGARGLLGPLYASFTEGFETPDLRDAKALLSVRESSERVASSRLRRA